MKTLLSVLFFVLALIMASSLVVGLAGEFGTSTSVWGNATIGTSVATGAVIDVFLGSGSTPNQTFTVGSQGSGVPSGYYEADVACDNTTAVFVKVWGINGTAVGCKHGVRTESNITVSLVANSAACSYANACSGGYCCSGATNINSSTGSGTCQASACSAGTTAATGGGGSGAGGGGAAGGGGTPTPAPAAPSQETIDIVKGALPATFQVAADAGNVEYKTISAPAVQSVSVVPAAVAQMLAQLVTIVKTDVAKAALAAIQQEVASGSSLPLSVTKTIEVIQATNKVTGEKVTVSVVKISIKAPADKGLKGVEVVEVIPKAAASSISQVTFTGEKPAVLEADPVVKWTFADILKGQTKDLIYVVNKDISSIGTSTVAVSKKAEAAPPAPQAPAPTSGKNETGAVPAAKKPTPVSTIALIVVVAAVVVAGWLFLRRKKSGSK